MSMITLHEGGMYLVDGVPVKECAVSPEEARKQTLAYSILTSHNTSGNDENLKIKFDAMASHDITYVGIIQTARASGLKEFPIPYAMTNCHNSLCAVGGTINEDDHAFGLSAAKKFGGIYVPANMSVIHSYVREQLTKCGGMILGSDSHTRYGALGTMAVGEGGPELVKQLLNNTWDVKRPEVVMVYLTGKPKKGIGPHDVAIALVGATFASGFVKNKVLEFVGPGIKNLSIEFRNGIDVMTTETTCLSSIWETDEETKKFYDWHNRGEFYKELKPGNTAYYDSAITINLDEMESMIALPFHPSNAYTIHDFVANADEILASVEAEAKAKFPKAKLDLRSLIQADGSVMCSQGVIAGCSGGTYENIDEAAQILEGGNTGNGYFSLSVYPTSMPVSMELSKNGDLNKLMAAGAVIKPSFCGPCFGAGDVPANKGLSIRHSTRNFPNREGSKVTNGQIASVALMDARSIAATAANKGYLTAATDIDVNFTKPKYFFDKTIYLNRVYNGIGKAMPETPIQFGPNIVDWPKMYPLTDHVLLKVVSVINDPVTTTDELIPSGETSSYRSNPLGLAEFTLSRKDPNYVPFAKEVHKSEVVRIDGGDIFNENSELDDVYKTIKQSFDVDPMQVEIGSCIYAVKPGDGSAREQAASCQRVLGGLANIAKEYATKRYRSNLINWGMLPFVYDGDTAFKVNDYIFVKDIRKAVAEGVDEIKAYMVQDGMKEISFKLGALTDNEREIIQKGCLINYNARG